MGNLHYKGYTGSLEFDDEGQYFFGHVLGAEGGRLPAGSSA